jgi:hypothetical protein
LILLRLPRDAERLWPGVLALAVALLFGALLFFLARGVNRPPMLAGVEVEPPKVPRGGSAAIRVHAQDPDGDAMVFAYSAESGRVEADAARPGEARYSPGVGGASADRLTVTVTDARGLTSARSVALTIEAPGAITPTPVPVPEAAPTAAPEASEEPAPMPEEPPLPIPTAAPPLATPVRPRPRAVGNRAPVVLGGTNLGEVEGGVVGLAASGLDPDADAVTFKWDFGPCVRTENVGQFQADVTLLETCDSANIVLTWTDVHGASASTEWNITR